jgi:hypothetical protein
MNTPFIGALAIISMNIVPPIRPKIIGNTNKIGGKKPIVHAIIQNTTNNSALKIPMVIKFFIVSFFFFEFM